MVTNSGILVARQTSMFLDFSRGSLYLLLHGVWTKLFQWVLRRAKFLIGFVRPVEIENMLDST